jgi:predicted tellurium resistance membrane protein TerC
MEWVIPFIALTAMEIVLGIDNIVFIAILAGRLPPEQRNKARIVGLSLALLLRIALLATLQHIYQMTEPLFTLTQLGLPAEWLDKLGVTKESNEFSTKDLILLGGGLFLLAKSVHEIHAKIEGHGAQREVGRVVSFSGVIVQILLLDIVFSIDSVITAVGMARDIRVMVAAVIVAVIVMLLFSGYITRFVDRHPTVKMLALSFLILIGVMLVAEALGTHIDKGYIYFAMAFALGVEMLNLRVRTVSTPKQDYSV